MKPNDPQPDLAVMRPAEAGAVTGGHVLAEARPMEVPAVRPMPSPLSILQAAIEQGITAESVAVVEKLAAMCREQRAEDARTTFNRAFFQLKREMPVVYADKEVKTSKGVAFSYCSPEEIKDRLEPLLVRHGFAIMGGQTLNAGEATVTLNLIHEAGHSEPRSFTVRVSPGNQLMSPSQCDAAASSVAERHCLIKMFQLRTRLKEADDPRNLGDMVSQEQADELERRAKETNSNIPAFLKFAGSKTERFADIPANRYAECDRMLSVKEKGGR